MSRSLFLMAALSLPLAAEVRAQAPAVAPAELELRVALAGFKAGANDPALAHMKAQFEKQGMAFQSTQLVSTQQVKLAPQQSASVTLPSGKVAQFTFVGREPDGRPKLKLAIGNVATLEVSVSKVPGYTQVESTKDGEKVILSVSGK